MSYNDINRDLILFSDAAVDMDCQRWTASDARYKTPTDAWAKKKHIHDHLEYD